MDLRKPACRTFTILLIAGILINCNVWSPAPTSPLPALVRPTLTLPVRLVGESAVTLPAPSALPEQLIPTEQPLPVLPTSQASVVGEPAGCLTLDAQRPMRTPEDGLSYADSLLGLSRPLAERVLPASWNAFTNTVEYSDPGVLSISVGNVQNRYLIQKMLNALHVAGFISWLRETPEQGLHILAFWLPQGNWQHSSWTPYLTEYWQDRNSTPSGDPHIIPALKLPPCRWMESYGFPPRAGAGWWNSDLTHWPDYTRPAATYLADTNEAAIAVSHRIGWLGGVGEEGPATMCGPLSWSILRDSGAFPPGWGAWMEGPVSFWLAKPNTNGRPWSLFPAGDYRVYSFHEPLGKFDFSKFRLYPGDFLYTYSKADGFDHMLVVTEVDSRGNVYTVTNIIQASPVEKITVQRVLLLNLNDQRMGIARNQWANDRVNGRTGHNGFEVFRWAWMEKDIQNQPATYTVEPGDTLELITALWKTPADEIARYNGIGLNTDLQVGQELFIPPIPIPGG